MVSGVLEPLSPLQPHPCPLLWPQGLFFSSSYAPWPTPVPLHVCFLFLGCSSPFLILVSFTSDSYVRISLRRTLLCERFHSLLWKMFSSYVKAEGVKVPIVCCSQPNFIPRSVIPFSRRENVMHAESLAQRLFCVCFCLELIIACLFILLGKWEKFVAGHSGLDRRIRLSPQVRHFFLFWMFII